MSSLMIFPVALLVLSLIALSWPRLTLILIGAVVIGHLLRHGL